ncbi:MAG: hypothetical protein E4G94_09075 [ANME-2 cluster archaeon]|nr:MAG: hypothetical protein E4G94_09075 [ANME-2 cluster archaeon]
MTYGFQNGDLNVGKTIQVFESIGLGVAIPRTISDVSEFVDWHDPEIHQIIAFRMCEFFDQSAYFSNCGSVWK